MDAAQALSDLTEISSQIVAAVLFDASGGVAASTIADDARSRELASAGAELLSKAERIRGAGDEQRLTQLEISTARGSVFVVRDDAARIVATTTAQPTVGLVFYDLKSCLRGLAAEEKPKPATKPAPKAKTAPKTKPKPRPRKTEADDAA